MKLINRFVDATNDPLLRRLKFRLGHRNHGDSQFRQDRLDAEQIRQTPGQPIQGADHHRVENSVGRLRRGQHGLQPSLVEIFATVAHVDVPVDDPYALLVGERLGPRLLGGG